MLTGSALHGSALPDYHLIITIYRKKIMMKSIELRNAIRSKYAWPGGYPMFGICSDGAALCIDCMRKEYKQIAYARKHNLRDGWRVDTVTINYEDTELTCEHCNQSIESAYGE